MAGRIANEPKNLRSSSYLGRPIENKCDWFAARQQSARGRLLVHFVEVTKMMKADIGVSEVEKQAAGAGEDA